MARSGRSQAAARTKKKIATPGNPRRDRRSKVDRTPSVGARLRFEDPGSRRRTMEVKVNVGILCALGLAWATLTIAEPSAALDPRAQTTRELAQMEDRFARDRRDAGLAEQLADAYLGIDRADLAV